MRHTPGLSLLSDKSRVRWAARSRFTAIKAYDSTHGPPLAQVALSVRHGYDPEEEVWFCPTRQGWALKPYERKTPELRARLAYIATVAGSYEETEKAATIWGTPVSDTSIHRCVQELGEQAQELTLPTPVPAPSEPAMDLVIMMDEWLTREGGPDWSAGPGKKNPQRVEWKVIKSAVMYRMDQRVEHASGRGLAKVKLQNYFIGAACNVKRWLRREAWLLQQAAVATS